MLTIKAIHFYNTEYFPILNDTWKKTSIFNSNCRSITPSAA